MRTLVLVFVLLASLRVAASCQMVNPVHSLSSRDTVFIVVEGPEVYTPLAGDVIATTGCLGGRIEQALDMKYLTDPVLPEVIAHEEVHRQQFQKYLDAHDGECPTISPIMLLAWEIEAYCAVREIGMKRFEEPRKEATDLDYISRLKHQFSGGIPAAQVEFTYRQRCP